MTRRPDATRGAPRAVWIVRHGERLDFVDPTWLQKAERPCDPPLAPAGVAQAHALAERLRGQGIEHLFASPFLRAVETADPIAAALDLRIKIEPGLSEWLSPAWFPQPPRLLPLEELAQHFPRIDPTYLPRGSAHHGERGEEALARSAATARRLVDDFQGHLLIVGHGASALGTVAGLLGIDAGAIRDRVGNLPYGGLVKLVRHQATWAIELAPPGPGARQV